jgi:hypothetical protein
MEARFALEADLGGDLPTTKKALVQQAACLQALCSDYGKRWIGGQLKFDELPSWPSARDR